MDGLEAPTMTGLRWFTISTPRCINSFRSGSESMVYSAASTAAKEIASASARMNSISRSSAS